ncbi:hypothetical protein [Thalassotalea sp. G2M2-11]|uniref:DUF6942 family protein n=1 Tax=Thalassotalea sp. G2M2-11 TaxID=2787627 RepID=UPI0019CF7F33|nr:hypothetical protein [Thalassotalea sp. G2M2-11]
MQTNIIGLGDHQATIRVHIEHRPPLELYQKLTQLQPLQQGDIANIATQTGNHWRKIFNVYAKFIYQLTQAEFDRWQDYRDQQLLQARSNTALIFTSPAEGVTKLTNQHNTIDIIMGKTFASKLGLDNQCHWLSPEFAVNKSLGIIICPYFDYRQLSNLKITRLCQLVQTLQS